MKKRFLENLFFFLTINLIIKPIYVFGIDREIQVRVGAEEYGTYFSIFNFVLIIQILLDLGIENFTRREIAKHPSLFKRYVSNIFVFKLLLAAIFSVVGLVGGLFIIDTRTEWFILIVLLGNQFLASFILYFRANMGGLHLFKSETIISVLDRLFMVLICGVLLYAPFAKNDFKIEWFVLAQTLSYFITFITSLVILFKRTGKIKLSANITPYIPIIKKLLPFATLVLLMAIYYRIDSILLKTWLPDGKEQAGIYAHGFRILDFMSNYALIFAFILLPTFSDQIRKKENIIPLLRLAVITLLVPSIALLTSVSFYRFDVFELLYDEHIVLSANTFIILTISFIGICISYTFGALLTANGNMRDLNIMALIAVILSISFNTILIPKHGVIGAAISNAMAQVFTIIFHIWVSKTRFNIKTDYPLLFKLFMFIAFSLIAGFLIKKLDFHYILSMALISSLSITFALSIKLISIKNVRLLLGK